MDLVSNELVLSKAVVVVKDASHTSHIFVIDDQVCKFLGFLQVNIDIHLLDSNNTFDKILYLDVFQLQRE